MTFQEMIDMVPADKRHLEIEVDVDAGPYPSGEEGAEDWIMHGSIESIEVLTVRAWRDTPERQFIQITVDYS